MSCRETMLSDVGELIYEGKDLKAFAKKKKISVASLVETLGIPLKKRVKFITTVEELEEAYEKLPKGDERQTVIDWMDKYCLKKLEVIPKNFDNILGLFVIYRTAFKENKAKKLAEDEINTICLPFFEKATVAEYDEISRIFYRIEDLKTLKVVIKAREILEKFYPEFCKMKILEQEKKDQELIEKTEDIEKLVKLDSYFKSERKKSRQLFLEKLDRRCLEEAEKAALSKDFKRLRKIYAICPQSDMFDKSISFKAGLFTFSAWRKICLEEVDNDPEVIGDLETCDYYRDDCDNEGFTITPGGYSILDEICTMKIMVAVTIDEVEKWNQIAPGSFLGTSESKKAAKYKKRKIFLKRLAKVTTANEAQKIYDNPLADDYVQQAAFKRIFKLS